MDQTKVYARLVTKDEYKSLRDTNILLSQPGEDAELIPAIDATLALDELSILDRDSIKGIHKLLGGSGAATRICFFRAKTDPVVKDIQLRRSDEIRKLVGVSFKEVKFNAGTEIELIA